MMNLFSALELGKNSILAQQSVFSIIGHNIANVNTEGYSRQVFDLENVRPSVIGLKEAGRGVNLVSVRSIRDQFIDNQITDRKRYKGKYDTLSSLMASIESLFDESHGLGLSDGLTNFFNAWADVANQPTDIPTRNSLVSKAQSFCLSLKNNFQRLTDQQEVCDSNIGVLVDEINSITNEIAKLNVEIAYANGSGSPANDLLDHRERRLRDLSEKIGINFYYEQASGSVTVEVAGRPLVSYNSVNELSAVRNQYNSNYYDIYIDQYGTPAINITTSITDGELGAMILARDGETVNGAGTLGAVAGPGAGEVTLTFTQAHELSVGDLVTINGETRSVISITSSTNLVIDDLSTSIAGSSGLNWQQRNGYIPAYKNQLNKLTTGLIYNVNSLHQPGYTLNSITTTNQNFFQMSTGSGTINIASVDTPIAGQTTITFSGSHSMSVGDIITVAGQTRLILTTPATNQVVVSNFTPALAGLPLSWEYANVQGAASTFQVDSNIKADSTLIAASSQPTMAAPFAVGNNDIALTIAQLMDSNNVVDTDNNGTGDYGTFHEYLHSLFSEIGNTSSTAKYESDANGSMLTYLENKRDSISGVSLDEEVANLMQFEKSFQALGHFMGTISSLTDLLMEIV